MTNPDRDELVKLANNIEAYGFECEGGSLANCEPWLELKRRLASSEGGVQGEPEPVANKRPVAFRVRKHKGSDQFDVFADETDARIRADARGIDYDGLYLVADRYTAPPADAGMREALDIAFCAMKDLRDALHREPSVQGRKWVHLGSSLNDAIRKAELALTAPGATTKSDGGEVITAEQMNAIEAAAIAGQPLTDPDWKQDQAETTRIRTSDPSSTRSDRWVCATRQRGITLDPQDCDWPVCGCDPLASKVLDTIAESGFVIVPKDPSSTRSEVTVENVAYQIRRALVEHYPAMNGVIRESVGDAAARALLDQFDIRRKK